MTKASDIWINEDADARVKEVKAWLKTKGVRDFEQVSLFADHLSKVGCIICFSKDINLNQSRLIRSMSSKLRSWQTILRLTNP
jgi:hypothetical protein